MDHSQHNHANHQSNTRDSLGVSYTCPMHPKIISDKPGMCPECGMNLVPAKQKAKKEADHEGHDKHAGHSTNIFKIKFWVSFALSIPVVLYSDIVQKFLGWEAPQFFGSEYLPFALSSIIFFTADGYL